MLGDGHIRKTYTSKNYRLEFTYGIKQISYINHLKQNIYSSICTLTPPTPYPSVKSGKLPIQYWFSTRSLIEITELYPIWYKEINSKFVKIVPLDIISLLTPIGLAHWIMDDGYWNNDSKTVVLCTDNFTEEEVLLLIDVLYNKFQLIAKPNKRKRETGITCWRIRFSRKNDNLNILRSLISPYLISEMNYKLGV